MKGQIDMNHEFNELAILVFVTCIMSMLMATGLVYTGFKIGSEYFKSIFDFDSRDEEKYTEYTHNQAYKDGYNENIKQVSASERERENHNNDNIFFK